MITSFRYSMSTLLGILNADLSSRFRANGRVHYISTSSFQCKAGTLFVPLKDKRDGHGFIPDALSNGANFFLCENNHPILLKLSKQDKQKAILVDDTLLALGRLARFHRDRFNPLIIGVTGSSGKTSTKDLLGNLFHFLSKKEVVITEMNYNNEIGVPFTLFRINDLTKVVICEMGMNHRGEIGRLSLMVKPQYAIITNIGSAHIENLKSPENIAHEKSDIMLGMANQAVIFVAEDINFINIVKNQAAKQKIKLVTWSSLAKSHLEIVKENRLGFELNYSGIPVKWNLPGSTLLSNVRGVIQVGEHIGLKSEIIAKAIKIYKSPDKRLNVNIGYFQIIDDSYNANPESMLSSISASLQVSGKNPLVWILGSMKELGSFNKKYHGNIGEELSKFPEHTLVTFGKDAEMIARKRKIGKNISFLESDEDLKDLILWVETNIRQHTTILVKGSRSMKMERIVDALTSYNS